VPDLPPCQLETQDFLFRFLHSTRVNPDGSVNSGAFGLRGDSELSLGIEKLIPPTSLEQFCSLKPGHGLAKVRMDEIRALGLDVQQNPEYEWGEFAEAHAILTGYADWSNSRKDEAARALRDAANKWGVVRAPAK
jgi:hypothetical protein